MDPGKSERTRTDKLTPGRISLPDTISRAIRCHQTGRLPKAETLYRRVLESEPDNPDALHFLGVLSHQIGRREAAVHMIGKAIALQPHYVDAINNLGNVFKEQGHLREAEGSYRQVLSLNPQHMEALNNLGVVLKERERYDEAGKVLARAVELQPDFADAHNNLGNVRRKQGRLDEAVAAYRRAIALKPFDPGAYSSLCRLLYIAHKYDQAVGVLEQWLEHDPASPLAAHMLAACTGRDIPDRASDEYVKQTFGRFAGSFDKVLERLEYRAPDLVTAVVAAEAGEPSGTLDTLDAGCGTGLCGPLLRPWASRFVGMDLSGAMLDKARGRDAYDELVEAELVDYMRRSPGAFDLIVSADTLVYFGVLREAAEAAAGALRAGGRLVFTVEDAADAEDAIASGFHLNPHGRYAHREEYVRRVLEHAGFTVTSIAHDTLRKEAGGSVAGLVVAARRHPK
jgi:predicted TPR repeat methyltransferase